MPIPGSQPSPMCWKCNCRHDKEAIIPAKSVITSDSYGNDGGEDDDGTAEL